MVGCKLLSSRPKQSIVKQIKFLTIPVLLFIIILASVSIYINKINGYGSESYKLRINDFQIAMPLFKQKIIGGWGYQNFNELVSHQDKILRNGDNSMSNGLVKILYEGGIYLGIMYLLPIIILAVYKYKKENKKYGSILLILYLLIELISFPFDNSYFIYYFMALGYANIIIKKSENPETLMNLEHENLNYLNLNIPQEEV